MSITTHIKEHLILGLPDAVASEFDGVQKNVGTGTHAVTMGGEGANYTTIATALYLFPFTVPTGATSIADVSAFTENNGATLMDSTRYALWDGNGVLLADGSKIIANPTLDSSKFVTDFSGAVAIPTKSFWVGFGFYDASASWVATECKARLLASAPGIVGVNSGTGFGSPRNAALILTNPTDAIPDPLLGVSMQDLPAPADSLIISVVATFT